MVVVMIQDVVVVAISVAISSLAKMKIVGAELRVVVAIEIKVMTINSVNRSSVP